MLGACFLMAQCCMLQCYFHFFCIICSSAFLRIQPINTSYHVQVYHHRIALCRGSRLCPSADLLFLVGAQGGRLLEGSWRSGSVGPLRYVVLASTSSVPYRRISHGAKSMLEGLRSPTVVAVFACSTNVCISVACSRYADRIGRVYFEVAK